MAIARKHAVIAGPARTMTDAGAHRALARRDLAAIEPVAHQAGRSSAKMIAAILNADAGPW